MMPREHVENTNQVYDNNSLEQITQLVPQLTQIQVPRAQNLRDYLKLSSVKRTTKIKINNIDLSPPILQPAPQHFHADAIRMQAYSRLIKHILKIEYHQFDYNFSPVNSQSSINLPNFEEISFIPLRLEHNLEKLFPDKKKQNMKNENHKVILNHHL